VTAESAQVIDLGHSLGYLPTTLGGRGPWGGGTGLRPVPLVAGTGL